MGRIEDPIPGFFRTLQEGARRRSVVAGAATISRPYVRATPVPCDRSNCSDGKSSSRTGPMLASAAPGRQVHDAVLATASTVQR